ncbi:hypothetical protein CA264_07735 [Pontibacter actiniarum]|uniref:Uncharacterized protein n=1 Tax=Pontibacter actiniarum TaxID=323450 RepID=A0A1X9YR42_9BACT|nr:hypothetical protein CA264_07735 [Pontibacter actiniarum]
MKLISGKGEKQPQQQLARVLQAVLSAAENTADSSTKRPAKLKGTASIAGAERAANTKAAATFELHLSV